MLWFGSLAAFLAFFTKGLSGFANTLVFSSVMGFSAEIRNITPVDLVLGIPSNLYIAWRERRFINPRRALPLIGTLLLGILPGTLLLRFGQDGLLKVLLGVAIILLAVEMFFRERGPKRRQPKPWALFLVGVASGFMCGLFGVGAFLVAYISRTTDNLNQMRGTLCLVFLAENLLRAGLYAWQGILTPGILYTALLLMPAMALGLAAGLLASRFFRDKTVRHFVIALLVVMGATMVWNNLAPLLRGLTQ